MLAAILTPGGALALSLAQVKEYSASASLLFRDPGFDQKLFGSSFSTPAATDAARQAATNAKLVSLEVVADRTQRRLPGVGKIRDKVSVSPQSSSDVIDVTATDRNPRVAARVANAFSSEFIAYRRQADRAKIREALQLVDRQLNSMSPQRRAGTEGRTLRGRSEELQILGSLQTGNAELAQAAIPPSSPSSPKTTQNVALGLVAGLLVGIGMAFLLERLDRRIRDPRELEEIFDRPVLGAIADSRVLARGRAGIGHLETGEREAFRMLRANLRYFNVDHHVSSVLVTSAAPGDGKTTVAFNLAATAAEGARVLLIEADLRHPSIAEGLGLRGVAGLSTVLAGQAEINEVVQEIPIQERSSNGRGLRTVYALLSGPLPPNPSDLLESDKMRDLLAQAEREYDLVVVDTPPTSVVSDAIPLVKQVGGVIVVGRIGRSTRDAATHLRNQLQNLNAPVLGVVVNALRSDSDAYRYAYAYGYSHGEQVSGQAPVAPRS